MFEEMVEISVDDIRVLNVHDKEVLDLIHELQECGRVCSKDFKIFKKLIKKLAASYLSLESISETYEDQPVRYLAEAIALENSIENKLKRAVKTRELKISLSLPGKIRIDLDDKQYFFLSRDDFSIDYLNWHGSYGDLLETYQKIENVLYENSKMVEKLMQSYENRSELI